MFFFVEISLYCMKNAILKLKRNNVDNIGNFLFWACQRLCKNVIKG